MGEENSKEKKIKRGREGVAFIFNYENSRDGLYTSTDYKMWPDGWKIYGRCHHLYLTKLRNCP